MTSRAAQAVQRQLHALDVYLLTSPKPDASNEPELRKWCVGLIRDTTFAANAIVWQAALESVAGAIQSHGLNDLGLTDEQSSAVARWIMAVDVTED